jgi:hypothetical protein
VGGFYFAQNWLLTDANNIKVKSYSSVSGALSSNELIRLQNDVNAHKTVSTEATQLFYSKQNYEGAVKQDLNNYASKTGITISDISATQAPTIDAGSTPVVGLTPEFFSVTINNPVAFNGLLEFIRATETNTPFMKLTGIDITGSTTSQSVTVKPMIIEVYTK